MELGIDFGTSFSTMSWLNPASGKPEVIRDENGLEKIPSVVYWAADGKHLVGKAAEDQFRDACGMVADERTDVLARTIRSVKTELLPDRSIPMPDGKVVSPVAVAAEILRYLKRNAEELCFHKKIKEVTIAHPVAFSQRQQTLLKDAASAAGFKSVELIPEPIAALHGYASTGATIGDHVIIFDLGGGTFDLAYLQKSGDGGYIPVLPPQGNAQCGGDAFDRSLYAYLEADCQKQMGFGFSADGQINAIAQNEARNLKERLSTAEVARFSFFDEGTHAAYVTKLLRQQFTACCSPLLGLIEFVAKDFLLKIEEAGGKVDTVLLIGGSTRIPAVVDLFASCVSGFSVKPEKTMLADIAVALGAIANRSKEEVLSAENRSAARGRQMLRRGHSPLATSHSPSTKIGLDESSEISSQIATPCKELPSLSAYVQRKNRGSLRACHGAVAIAKTDDYKRMAIVCVQCESKNAGSVPDCEGWSDKIAHKLITKKDDVDILAFQGEASRRMGDTVTLPLAEVFEHSENGCLAGHVHLRKIASIVELECSKMTAAKRRLMDESARLLAVHIAGAAPKDLDGRGEGVQKEIGAATLDEYLRRAQVRGEIPSDSEFYAIKRGVAEKYLNDNCLLWQHMISDESMTVYEYLENLGRKLRDAVTIRRFVRICADGTCTRGELNGSNSKSR